MSKKTLSEICNLSLIDSKAKDLLMLDVKNISTFADRIIIATASSNRHASSVSEKLVDFLPGKQIRKLEDGTYDVEYGECSICFALYDDLFVS